MINFIKNGNLFCSNKDAIVNTVNCVGVMGKGIALQFKEHYPNNYKLYKNACNESKVKVGKMFVTENGILPPKFIINFPTKKHWRGKSDIKYIKDGLEDLKRVLVEYNIRSVAIPALGAGNGGLYWENVKKLIIKELSDLEKDIDIYEPIYRFNEIKQRKGA